MDLGWLIRSELCLPLRDTKLLYGDEKQKSKGDLADVGSHEELRRVYAAFRIVALERNPTPKPGGHIPHLLAATSAPTECKRPEPSQKGHSTTRKTPSPGPEDAPSSAAPATRNQ